MLVKYLQKEAPLSSDVLPPPSSTRLWSKWAALLLLAALLTATRSSDLSGPIDEPHSWRQCDTAFYAYSFHIDQADFLRPAVCWMGNHRTTIFEFPLVEWLMACTYDLFGYHLALARCVTLLFFSGAAFYLYLIVRRFGGERLALLTMTVYSLLPLSWFYSRAIHVDFAAVFFAHMMTYHLIRCSDRWSLGHLTAATIGGVLGFLIKVPYLFYFVIPLFLMILWRRSWRGLFALGVSLGIASISFLLWRHHVDVINGAVPDWSFIPGYRKMVDMGSWYFGALEMRTDWGVWHTLLTRIGRDILTPPGVVLLSFGAITSVICLIKHRTYHVVLLWGWGVGVVSYVLIFLNLNVIHDYYQIPILAVTSIFIAMGLNAPLLIRGRRGALGVTVSLVMGAWLMQASWQCAKTAYGSPDNVRQYAAELLEELTPEYACVIVAPDIPGTDSRDPRILARAHRVGWSIYKRNLSHEIIAALILEGATHLAILAQFDDVITSAYGYDVTTYSVGIGRWKLLYCDLTKIEEHQLENGRGQAESAIALATCTTEARATLLCIDSVR